MIKCRRIITILQVYVDALSYKYFRKRVFSPISNSTRGDVDFLPSDFCRQSLTDLNRFISVQPLVFCTLVLSIQAFKALKLSITANLHRR